MTQMGSSPAAAAETPWRSPDRTPRVGALRFGGQELAYTVHVRHWL
jgi:hypothetical protein